MKKFIIIFALLASLLLSGCDQMTEQQRLTYIREKYSTNDIWWYNESSSHYIVRMPDGSVWTISRSSMGKPEDLTTVRIFVPNK